METKRDIALFFLSRLTLAARGGLLHKKIKLKQKHVWTKERKQQQNYMISLNQN